MEENRCIICQEYCDEVPADHQLNLCFHRDSGMPMPCCGQNGTEPPLVHLRCFMKVACYAKEHHQVFRCPLCRVNLEPYLNQERSFRELKNQPPN